MLTSYLPGQEEGNVDFVVDGGFGAFVSDSNPNGIAEEVAQWLTNDETMQTLSEKAKACGAPNAARDIVQQIGKISLKWKKINDDREKLELAAENLKLGIPSNDEDNNGVTA
jgi:1,2-diacylglycerol 3-beta-galactosyltransferase